MILSRRAILAAGAGKLVGLSPNAPTPSPLVVAGKRFDELSARLDSSESVDEKFWSDFRTTANQLVGMRATSTEDYFAKARAAAWARLGDLDPPCVSTLDIRIAISVLRDIVLQNDARLFNCGALNRMYSELEGD